MKCSAAKKAAFADLLVEGQTPETAAKAIGIDRATAYRWKAGDPEVAAHWDDARERKIENVENMLYRMAMERDIQAVKEFLRAYRPEVFNRRPILEVTRAKGSTSSCPPMAGIDRRKSRMSQRPSKAKRIKRRSAEVISREELGYTRLVERGLAGHVPSIIAWLQAYGGPAWRLPPSCSPPGRYDHNPGRGSG